jgi:photosystem II stability/assembly factor-like uncharacterized protein
MEETFIYAGGARIAGKPQTRGGIFRLRPRDDYFEKLTNGMPEDNDVYTITIDPQNPEIVFAGTRLGLYRSLDRGEHWQALGLPGPSVEIWSLLAHPENPRLLYAGASPVAVFRSDDNGDHWRRLPDPMIPNRVPMPFACRVMRLAANPNHADELYAVLEVNGVMRSRDGGESWEDCSAELIRFAQHPRYKNHLVTEVEAEGMLDGHALSVSATEPVTVYLAVRMGLFRSTDCGLTWSDMEVGRFSPLTYGRDIRISPQDPQVMYACLSPAARSETGAIYRSSDQGTSWQLFLHSVTPRATMMSVALHPGDPRQVYGVSRCGQVFGTRDGGATWHEFLMPEGCRDVYSLACA